MRISKTEVNLRRLLDSSPRQQNQAKLIHYVTTAREFLEQLGTQATSDAMPSISKAKLIEYSDRIEALASKIAAPLPEETNNAEDAEIEEECTPQMPHVTDHAISSSGLRKRTTLHLDARESGEDTKARETGQQIKLDEATHTHIEKHRKLQEDLTDEMVVLARRLKESSLTMSQSIQETEKILDSTVQAVEHSLASTGHASTRAGMVYTETSKTTCFTWLLIFAMTCIFFMVVLLIRVT